MILNFILQWIVNILSFIVSWLPTVTELPYGSDSVLLTGIQRFNYVKTVIPPFDTLFDAFMWIMVWKITLYVLRWMRIIK